MELSWDTVRTGLAACASKAGHVERRLAPSFNCRCAAIARAIGQSDLRN